MNTVEHANAGAGLFTPGQLLDGRYELIAPIGIGGMGSVWIAKLRGVRGFRRFVAIKTLLAGADQLHERYLVQEANVTSQIHHPNVCETIELGESGGAMYLVLELVNGESLSRLLSVAAGSALPLELAVNVVGQLCAGLHAAHELRDERGALLGLVHRDISPQNVLVGYSGVVKLLDFGISKLAESDGLTRTGELRGKVSYMAPETLMSADVDRRVDLWAIGVVLYQVTTGRLPFKRANANATLMAILNESPEFPSSFITSYPAELESVVMRCLEKKPEARYQSAAEILAALEAAFPAAFSLSGERSVAEYVHATCADRVLARQQLLAQAEASSPSVSGVRPRPSEQPTELLEEVHAAELPETVPSPPALPEVPLRRSRLPLVVSVVTLAVGGVLLMGAMRPVGRSMSTPAPAPAVGVVSLGAPTFEEPTERINPPPSSPTTSPAPRPAHPLAVPQRSAPSTTKARQGLELRQRETMPEEYAEPVVASGLDVPAPAPSAEPTPAPALETPAPSPEPKREVLPAKPRAITRAEAHALLAVDPNSFSPRIPHAFEGRGPWETAVRVCVSETGAVQSARVLRSLGEALDVAVARAISGWRYRPFVVGGAPQPFCYQFAYAF